MRDFLKRKFLSILNLFLVCRLEKKERDEQHGDETRQPAALPFPKRFPFGRTTAV